MLIVDLIVLIIIFVFGLFIGSFLNVLVDRLPFGKPIVLDRSCCDNCKHTLGVLDLFPLFSFLFLQGKCRYCHSPIGLWYPVVELTTGILFLASYIFIQSGTGIATNFQFSILNSQLIYYLIIISGLIVIFFADLKYGLIPDKILIPLIVITFLFLFINLPDGRQVLIQNNLLSAIGAFLFFLLLFLGTKGKGMGFGDVKFAFFMGLLLGFPNIILALYVAFLTGAIVAIILIVARQKKFKGGTIPFGPFLIFGTLIALFFGSLIIERFFSYLL